MGIAGNLSLVLLLLVVVASGKVFERCELARELVRQGLSQNDMNVWVCLVENESNSNTRHISGPNSDGSYDYGIFNLNTGAWCQMETNGGSCNAKCEGFIDDDITDDTRCAKYIFDRFGFNAWWSYQQECNAGSSLPDVAHCFN